VRIEALTATTKEPENGFNEAQLVMLAETAIGVPVLMQFDQERKIGVVVDAKVTGPGLKITADIDESCDGLYLVPGYINSECRSEAFRVTKEPQDKTLSPIKTVKKTDDVIVMVFG
jgi:hypothetical protein